MNPPRRIGPYRVERLLGFGSFATVWLGHDPALDARVAIKVLAENWCHDLRVRERFLDEARLLWRLDHERLVRVYSVGELADGRPYLVMAWAAGGSLRDRLAAGPMPVGSALRVLREIAAGVGVLHAHGIVHRDLTPGNVLFQPRPSAAAPADTAVAGAASRGVAVDDTAPDGAAPDGSTAEGGTADHTASDRTTAEGSTADHTASDRSTAEGSTTDHTASDRSTAEGSTTDHTASDRSTAEGSTTDHTASDRSTAEGSTTDHTASDRSTAEGSTTDHTASDRTTVDSGGAGHGSGSGRGGTGESVLIADLGLAKALAAASGLTARAGTPGYMAPEQDSPAALVDARADVFGLGRLGATLLGTSGPDDDPPEVPALRAGVPPGVAAVLRRATARTPAERYPDAAAFAAALDLAIDAGPSPRPRRVPRARPRRLWAAALLGAAALVATAFATFGPGWPGRDSRIGADSTGRITVALPEGWQATGSGWIGQRGPDGDLEPALVMSPDPERWSTDPAVPGAFVGLSRSLADRHDPAGYVAEHPHAECEPAPVRTVRRGDVDWYVAAFTACRTGKPAIVEAAGNAPDAAGLVYVQIAPPAGASADFVDTLLAGIRVRR
ncbi:protein kinase domain-containing protein [Plantactinospora sp. CA-294935]|uniref:serine/threonine-protein kinase n=1 Tax=Plantactinospora sp. CA-294935 TaxID=3240012 RepID=UPI003D92D563